MFFDQQPKDRWEIMVPWCVWGLMTVVCIILLYALIQNVRLESQCQSDGGDFYNGRCVKLQVIE